METGGSQAEKAVGGAALRTALPSDCAHLAVLTRPGAASVSSAPAAAGPAPTGQWAVSGSPQWGHSAPGLALPVGERPPRSTVLQGDRAQMGGVSLSQSQANVLRED